MLDLSADNQDGFEDTDGQLYTSNSLFIFEMNLQMLLIRSWGYRSWIERMRNTCQKYMLIYAICINARSAHYPECSHTTDERYQYISKESTEMRLVGSTNGVNYYMEFVAIEGRKYEN